MSGSVVSRSRIVGKFTVIGITVCVLGRRAGRRRRGLAILERARTIPQLMQLDIPAGDFAGYIFDLDGTLIDTMPLHYLAWDTAMRAHGLREPLNEDLFYSLGGVPTVRVAELIAAHYRLVIEPLKVEHTKEQAFLERLGQVEPIAPVVAFARRVAMTRPVAIATGGMPEVALPAIHAAGLGDLFKIVVTPLDVGAGRGKPAPDMFLLAAEKMGVSAAECLVFEDAEPGIRAALAAGMQVVRVPSRKVAVG
jgi:HAD superfamily hydrolase (TIGR01509 family)